MIVIVMVMHYFHPMLEHGLPPSLNLKHNAYSFFHAFTWSVKAWHVAHRYISTLPELSDFTHFRLYTLYTLRLYTLQKSQQCNLISLNKQQEQASFCRANSYSSHFTVERAAKTLHQMPPCTPVSVSVKSPGCFIHAAIFLNLFDAIKIVWCNTNSKMPCM